MRYARSRWLSVISIWVLLAGTMTVAQTTAQQTAPVSATPGAIAEDPEDYYGKRVSVRAEVEDVISPQVFLLDEDRLFAWPDVLVITPKTTGAIPEDEIVTVTGTVRPFTEAELRRDYDWGWWADLQPNFYVTFRDRPVIIADSVTSSAGAELVRR